MPRVFDRFHWPRIVQWLVIPAVIYATVAISTDAEKLNPTEILVLISLSAAVCVAFLPNFYRFFLKSEPVSPVGVACVGIFAGWVSNVYRPSIQLAVTLFPGLSWIRDSDVVSAGLAVAIYAGLCHLLAPAVTEFGDIPPRRWARAGMVVGFGLFAAMVVFYWPRVSAIWEGRPVDQFQSNVGLWNVPGTAKRPAIVVPQGEPSGDFPATAILGERNRRSIAASVTYTLWERIERHRIAQGERSTAAAVRDLLEQALDAEDKAGVQQTPDH